MPPPPPPPMPSFVSPHFLSSPSSLVHRLARDERRKDRERERGRMLVFCGLFLARRPPSRRERDVTPSRSLLLESARLSGCSAESSRGNFIPSAIDVPAFSEAGPQARPRTPVAYIHARDVPVVLGRGSTEGAAELLFLNSVV